MDLLIVAILYVLLFCFPDRLWPVDELVWP
jgi:hypothetical protein